MAVIAALAALAIAFVTFSLRRPTPLSYEPTARAVATTDSMGRSVLRATIDASAENRWRFFSLARGELLDAPGPLDWDLAFRRFHIATNGGPGFAGAGAAGIEGNGRPAELRQTNQDTTESGFGKWYEYGFTSHLLTPKPLAYRVHAADGVAYQLRIVSYYCPGASPGCVTIEYSRVR